MWLILVALWLPEALVAQEGSVQVIFLDVGQGDAVLVRAPAGQSDQPLERFAT